jgi:catalase
MCTDGNLGGNVNHEPNSLGDFAQDSNASTGR